jgi:predicted HTH transcriptional regulator
MNSDGGILLIGVNDDGQINGIAEDEFGNEDKCQLHFKNLINSHIGTAFARYIHLKFCHFDDKTVLVIECERVRKPVFLSIGKTEDFYIRTGPSSMKLTMSSMVTYLSER